MLYPLLEQSDLLLKVINKEIVGHKELQVVQVILELTLVGKVHIGRSTLLNRLINNIQTVCVTSSLLIIHYTVKSDLHIHRNRKLEGLVLSELKGLDQDE